DTTPAGTKQRILADVERISRLLLLPPFWRRRITRMILEARRTRRGRPVRVLDIGAGGGGLLFRLEDWARAHRIPVELHGADYDADAVAAAQRRAGEEGRRVAFRAADARRLDDIADGGVDVAVTTFMLHHLSPGDVACVLHQLDRVAAVNFFAFDVRRSALAVPALWAFLRVGGFDAPTRHDAMASLRRAYTPAELAALLAAAGVANATVEAVPPAWVVVARA
ncbi:MAG TPA: methyltransferase domain-containing protein, partial [Haliangiales bacterium]|nr:methyltransferase domain-containing protein [Haliangiales bacterium]